MKKTICEDKGNVLRRRWRKRKGEKKEVIRLGSHCHGPNFAILLDKKIQVTASIYLICILFCIPICFLLKAKNMNYSTGFFYLKKQDYVPYQAQYHGGVPICYFRCINANQLYLKKNNLHFSKLYFQINTFVK